MRVLLLPRVILLQKSVSTPTPAFSYISWDMFCLNNNYLQFSLLSAEASVHMHHESLLLSCSSGHMPCFHVVSYHMRSASLSKLLRSIHSTWAPSPLPVFLVVAQFIHKCPKSFVSPCSIPLIRPTLHTEPVDAICPTILGSQQIHNIYSVIFKLWNRYTILFGFLEFVLSFDVVWAINSFSLVFV